MKRKVEQIFTDENVLGVLQQVLRFLIAGVHRDELDLLHMYDHAVFAEEHVSGRPWPEEPGVPSTESDAAGQRSPRRSDRSPLASSGDASPRPRALKRSTIEKKNRDNVKFERKHRRIIVLFITLSACVCESFPYDIVYFIISYLNKHQTG